MSLKRNTELNYQQMLDTETVPVPESLRSQMPPPGGGIPPSLREPIDPPPPPPPSDP